MLGFILFLLLFAYVAIRVTSMAIIYMMLSENVIDINDIDKLSKFFYINEKSLKEKDSSGKKKF